jgi:ABC-2 type transport system permease protein
MTAQLQNPSGHLAPMLDFAAALFRASLRDVRGTLMTFCVPLVLLVVFALTDNGKNLKFVLPFTIGLVAMFSGSGLAMRIVNWRTQRVFQRLAITPVPVGWLIMSMVLVQMVITLIQTVVVLVVGVAWTGLAFTPVLLATTLGFVFLGTLCFLSFGAMLSTFVSRVEAVNSLYVFTLMPMSVLGGSLIEIPLIGKLGDLLPTTMFTHLLSVIVGKLDVAILPTAIGGLLLYALVFSGISLKRFRLE